MNDEGDGQVRLEWYPDAFIYSDIQLFRLIIHLYTSFLYPGSVHCRREYSQGVRLLWRWWAVVVLGG